MGTEIEEAWRLCRRKCDIIAETLEKTLEVAEPSVYSSGCNVKLNRKIINFNYIFSFAVCIIAAAAIGYFGLYAWRKSPEKAKNILVGVSIILGVLTVLVGLYMLFCCFRELS